MNCNQTISVYVMMRQRISALGIQQVLSTEKDLEVIVLAPKYATDLRRVCDFRPDVVITDVDTCSRQPADAIQEIRESGSTKFLFVYSPSGDSTAVAVKLGADGLVSKSSPAGTLGAAVRSLAAGKVWIDESIWRHYLHTDKKSYADLADDEIAMPSICGEIPKLSPQELELLRLASQGLSNREIAQILEMSLDTINCYMWLITKKFRARGRIHALNIARQCGIFS